MAQLINHGNHIAGELFKEEQAQLFFGTQFCDPDKIAQIFPGIELRQINQLHGNITVKSSAQIQSADSHWTDQPQVALIIRTADCLPILGFSPKHKVAVAIHAGWRGLANGVIKYAFQSWPGEVVPDFKIWIGPHIQKCSYHVSESVATMFDVTGPFIDLAEIAQRQLVSHGIEKDRITISPIDTFTDPLFASFRRDRTNTRQFSFVCLNS